MDTIKTKNAMTKTVFGYRVKKVPEGIRIEANYDEFFVVSSEVVDRWEEVIDQNGWELQSFQKNPVMLAGHRHWLDDGASPVIGKWVYVAVVDGAPYGVTGKALVGAVKFADTALGREYKTLYADGFMSATSVGFLPIEGGKQERGGEKVYVHTKQELLEISAVAVPANPEALKRMRAAGIHTSVMDSAPSAMLEVREGPKVLTIEHVSEMLEIHSREMRGFVAEKFETLIAIMPDGVEGDFDHTKNPDPMRKGEVAPARSEPSDRRKTGLKELTENARALQRQL